MQPTTVSTTLQSVPSSSVDNAALDKFNSVGLTPLCQAAIECSIHQVGQLLRAGASVDLPDLHGATPLQYASSSMTSRGLPVMRMLLAARANPNRQNPTDGYTLLMYAVTNSPPGDCASAIAEMLVAEYGADIDRTDHNGHTAIAVSVLLGRNDWFLALLKLGANVHTSDVRGKTLLHRAVHDSDPTQLKILLERRVDVNQEDNNTCTPLRELMNCYKGDAFVRNLSMLLEAGATVDQQCKEGKTMLHCIAGYRVTAASGGYRGAELLLEAKADANKEDARGWRPLDYAVNGFREGSVEMARLLLTHGACATLVPTAGSEISDRGRVYNKRMDAIALLLEEFASATPPPPLLVVV